MAVPGLAVVISPLISLMKDQVDALTTCGVPAAYLNSSQLPAERCSISVGFVRKSWPASHLILLQKDGRGSLST